MAFTENWQPVQGAAGFETISVTSAAPVGLTIAPSASLAEIQIIGDATNTDEAKAVLMSLNGLAPSATNGFLYGNGVFRFLLNRPQLDAIKFLSYEALKVNTIKVQYYYSL